MKKIQKSQLETVQDMLPSLFDDDLKTLQETIEAIRHIRRYYRYFGILSEIQPSYT